MLIIHDVKVKLTCECGATFTDSFPAADKDVIAECPHCKREWPLYIEIQYKGYEQ